MRRSVNHFSPMDPFQGYDSKPLRKYLPSVLLARKVGVEFIGTLILVFSGTTTTIVNEKTHGSKTLIEMTASSGLAVMILILATGHIFGAHFNPVLTISFAALKKFPWKHVPAYIVAQMSASFCATFLLKAIFHPIKGVCVTVPSIGYVIHFVSMHSF